MKLEPKLNRMAHNSCAHTNKHMKPKLGWPSLTKIPIEFDDDPNHSYKCSSAKQLCRISRRFFYIKLQVCFDSLSHRCIRFRHYNAQRSSCLFLASSFPTLAMCQCHRSLGVSDMQLWLCHPGLAKRSGEPSEPQCRGRTGTGDCPGAWFITCVYINISVYLIKTQLFAGKYFITCTSSKCYHQLVMGI